MCYCLDADHHDYSEYIWHLASGPEQINAWYSTLFLHSLRYTQENVGGFEGWIFDQ